MQKIILEFLQQHEELEYTEILNMVLNHEQDFSISNIRSIVHLALKDLEQKGLIVLVAYHRVGSVHKYFYKIA